MREAAWRVPGGETTARTAAEPTGASQDPATAESDPKIVEALGAVAAARGVGQALIALAWLRRNPIVAAPIVGALKPKHIDDAIAALSIVLTDDEAASLEAHYTPRRDFQGMSDTTVLHRMAETVTGFKASQL